MLRFLEWLDNVSGANTESRKLRWMDRIAFFFLILMTLSAPHSIAATQTAWLIGMAVWLVRLASGPRKPLKLRTIDIALWGLFGWSLVSSLFSYEPAVSLDRMRGVSVFLIFYFVAGNIRHRRAAYFLSFALIFSCIVNVLWMPIERIFGRGVEIHQLSSDGAALRAKMKDGDTILTVNGKKVRSPEAIVTEIETTGSGKIKLYRQDYDVVVDVGSADLGMLPNAEEKLGIGSWKTSRNWRSAGFFGHYTTYAEALQLIASLALGLLVAGFLSARGQGLRPEQKYARRTFILLSGTVAAMCVVLLMTVTRGSQLAFAISGFVIFLIGAKRKWFGIGLAVGVSLAAVGLLVVQQTREKGFFDPTDDSTLYRFTMWRDGLRIWSESIRNMTFGVGMDSIQKHWQEWNMFDGGKMPLGHFHSTPIQLLTERGLPAVLFWFAVLISYSVTILKPLRVRAATLDWRSAGILLGCFGGMCGFVVSGIAHYNLGDQEVAMIFFFLMALGFRICEIESFGKPVLE